MPFGIPQRANVAALSLRSYLREIKQFQTLRWRFDGKPISASRNHKFACWLKQTSKHCTPTRKCHAPNDCNHFCPLLRTRFSTNFKQKRKAKILAKRLPVQTTRRGYPASADKGVPRGNAWARFFRPLLGAHQEGASKTTRSARDKGAQYDRM